MVQAAQFAAPFGLTEWAGERNCCMCSSRTQSLSSLSDPFSVLRGQLPVPRVPLCKALTCALDAFRMGSSLAGLNHSLHASRLQRITC